MVEEVERWGYRRSVRGGAKDRGKETGNF